MAVVTSVQTGDFDAAGTWDTGVPAGGDTVIIAAGHAVTITDARSTVGNITWTINAGSSLIIGSGGSLTSGAVAVQQFTINATGAIYVIDGGVLSAALGGTIMLSGGTVYLSGGGILRGGSSTSTFSQVGANTIRATGGGEIDLRTNGGTLIMSATGALYVIQGGKLLMKDASGKLTVVGGTIVQFDRRDEVGQRDDESSVIDLRQAYGYGGPKRIAV